MLKHVESNMFGFMRAMSYARSRQRHGWRLGKLDVCSPHGELCPLIVPQYPYINCVYECVLCMCVLGTPISRV